MTREDRLAELLERWESAVAVGNRPTPEEFLRDTPEDLPAFRSLLKQLGAAGLLTVSGPVDLSSTPAQFRAGRYTATDYHAEGGLGIVYRAHDEELNRTVALKCMKSVGSSDSAVGRRFLLEAEITSRLDHPGIAPVHGRGSMADGRPFYAMRFIEGETLQSATRRFHAPAGIAPGAHNVELRRLLRAFVAVCETMAYAHTKAIIHRDLKPSNVMVGPFGEVLVMDWGLARIGGGTSQETGGTKPETRDKRHETRDPRHESESAREQSGVQTPIAEGETPRDDPRTPRMDLTIYGRAKGSPSFMSPEQARGEWDRVGPASDIYSLGSTLYYLLTGKVPFDGKTSGEVVARVRTGEFLAPRKVDTRIPTPLDAVCRKAMAFVPDERYRTAKELADDVERWLADEPVSAWREPLSVRVRRWARRHRTAVTATAAALVVGFVLLAIAGYRLERKNRDLDQANTDLTEANRRESAERAKAEQRFDLALGSATALVTDIQTKLIRAPGTRAVRESLLKDAMARLEVLVRQADDARDVNRTMIWARLRLGDLYRDVEQNPTKAESEFRRGLELARDLLQRHPRHPLITVDAIEALQRLGQIHTQLGHFAQAGQLFAEAAALIAEAGTLADEQRARNLSYRAQLELETGNAEAAATLLNEARWIWDTRATGGTDQQAVEALAHVLYDLGQAADRAGRYRDAEAHHAAALAKWRELKRVRPGDVTIERRLALAHLGLAHALAQLGRRDSAAVEYAQYFALTRTLADRDPENAEATLALALAHNGLALDAIGRFDLQTADMHMAKAMAITDSLAHIDANNIVAQRNYAYALSQLADLARKRQKPTEAAQRFAEAIAVARRILVSAPEQVLVQADLAEWLKDVARVYLFQLSDVAKGQSALDESMARWSDLTGGDASNLDWQVRRLEAYDVLRSLRHAQKKYTEAESTIRAGLEPVERLPAADRAVGSLHRAAGRLRWRLIELDRDRARIPEASAASERAVEELQREARLRPDDAFVWELLDRHHTLLAEIYSKQGANEKSADQRRSAIEACRTWLKLDAADAVPRRNLQIHLAFQAERAMSKDPAVALKLIDEALAHKPRFTPDIAATSILSTSFAALEAKAGDCCEMLNRPKEALDHYREALTHHENVAKIEPSGPGIPGIIAYDHRRMAELCLTLLDFKGAVEHYERAQAIIDRMRADKRPLRLLDQQTAGLIKTGLPFARSLPMAIATQDEALQQPDTIRPDALRLRIAMLLRDEKSADAVATAEKLAELKRPNGDAFARAAVEFMRLQKADRALELLRKAMDAGYFQSAEDVAWLSWEPLFAPLRQRENFRSLVKELTAKTKN